MKTGEIFPVNPRTGEFRLPANLGMYVTSGPRDFDATVGGGAWASRGSFGVTDTAGNFAPGTRTDFRSVTGGGGIRGSVDISGLFALPADQGLQLSGTFDYVRSDIDFGATGDTSRIFGYSFKGELLYNINSFYVRGAASYGFGNGNSTQVSDGSTASFDTDGHWGDIKIGNIFVLANTLAQPRSGKKGPPSPDGGGYVFGFDLSGHVGYTDTRLYGFTDSTGFIVDGGNTHFGAFGGRAQLFAIVPYGGVFWMPFVTGTVDQRFGYSSTVDIPVQAGVAAMNTITTTSGLTFWGGELGLEVRNQSGWQVGIKGFYLASSDTDTAGGTVYVRIPLSVLFASR
jgi:hypothetical protein